MKGPFTLCVCVFVLIGCTHIQLTHIQSSREREHGNVEAMLGKAERSWEMEFVCWDAGPDARKAVGCMTTVFPTFLLSIIAMCCGF